jgi:CDP-diacylglycerol--glycerol-3-phosphate 3-phosphatidyltransferase
VEEPGLTPSEERRAPLTFRRLVGLDRSGPPPPQTLSGAPLNVWTVPNAIGFLRLALLPVFVVTALGDDNGETVAGAVLFGAIGWLDYADGIAARVTGQYSRFGALLDPLVDRLLILSGVIVCWHFELLPRWALAVLAARELTMVVLTRAALRRGVQIKINWWGRLAVTPVMSAPFFGMLGVEWLAKGCLYVGLAMALIATAFYVRDGLQASSEG